MKLVTPKSKAAAVEQAAVTFKVSVRVKEEAERLSDEAEQAGLNLNIAVALASSYIKLLRRAAKEIAALKTNSNTKAETANGS